MQVEIGHIQNKQKMVDNQVSILMCFHNTIVLLVTNSLLPTNFGELQSPSND